MREPQPPRAGDAEEFDCQRCGRFALGGSAGAELPRRKETNPKFGHILSHAIRRLQRPDSRPLVDYYFANGIFEDSRLPSPAKQSENLLQYLGEQLSGPGERVRVSEPVHGAIVGSGGDENFFWLIKHLLNAGLVEGGQDSAGALLTLAPEGWRLVEELRKGRSAARIAFMAMPYDDAELDEVMKSAFRPAVEATGFRLERLDDDPSAGLIDDRLRVKIRTCRFLVSDLTGGNQGAYWEAGFAEGLGKPVIYSCEKQYFKERKTHFDTNHHLTVIWEKEHLEDAVERLKATIRATLPDEAKLTDER